MRWQTQILSSALGEPPPCCLHLCSQFKKLPSGATHLPSADMLNVLFAPDKIQKAIIYCQPCFILMETTLIKNSQRCK